MVIAEDTPVCTSDPRVVVLTAAHSYDRIAWGCRCSQWRTSRRRDSSLSTQAGGIKAVALNFNPDHAALLLPFCPVLGILDHVV